MKDIIAEIRNGGNKEFGGHKGVKDEKSMSETACLICSYDARERIEVGFEDGLTKCSRCEIRHCFQCAEDGECLLCVECRKVWKWCYECEEEEVCAIEEVRMNLGLDLFVNAKDEQICEHCHHERKK